LNGADERPPEPLSTTCWGPDAFRRHVFARLAKDAWRHAVPETGGLATLRDWIARGHPLIVRRPCRSDDGGEVFLGLALPGRRRLSYRVRTADVLSLEPPPLWTGGDFLPFRPRLFGSHAWQELTGLEYITPTSDVDLFLDIGSLAEWRMFCTQQTTFPPPRIDLEIVFRGDAAFSWREFLGPAKDLLLKSNRRVWLEPRDQLDGFLK